MKKAYTSFTMVFLCIQAMFAQDLICTISAELNGSLVSIDSLKIENLSNGSGAVYTDLPERSDYRINLSKNEFWGSTQVEAYAQAPALTLVASMPGKLVLRSTKNLSNVRLRVYDLKGTVYEAFSWKRIGANKLIEGQLPGERIYFVQVLSSEGSQSFKVRGASTADRLVFRNDGMLEVPAPPAKSTLTDMDGDFTFSAGDQIRVSVYKGSYTCSPADFTIGNENISLSFILEAVFIDHRDNHEYKWVEINGITWMAENLVYDMDGAYPYSAFYKPIYGNLYKWENAKVACPQGWHLPSDEEWEELAKFVSQDMGGYELFAAHDDELVDDWKEVGYHLKAKLYWYSPADGIDTYGFSALGGGHRAPNGAWNVEKTGIWWSQNETNDEDVWVRYINNGDKSFYRWAARNYMLYSVRCIKDRP